MFPDKDQVRLIFRSGPDRDAKAIAVQHGLSLRVGKAVALRRFGVIPGRAAFSRYSWMRWGIAGPPWLLDSWRRANSAGSPFVSVEPLTIATLL